MRELLLPVLADAEEAGLAVVQRQLESKGVRRRDLAAWVRAESQAWRSSGKAGHLLVDVIRTYLKVSDDGRAIAVGSSYFKIHRALVRRPLVDHAGASSLLSHARLIAQLAADERMSSAQVAKLVAARDSRAPARWQEVELILRQLALAPTLELSDIQALYEKDEALEVDVFADADEYESIQLIDDVGARLGFPGSLLAPLLVLMNPDGTPRGPYLQMLHAQCTIAEHYDHEVSVLYEFNPRGPKWNWLFAQYPSALEVAKNPFLNNAKGVGELDLGWATSKKPAMQSPAHALVTVLSGLDAMGYAARRELAAWLRRLIVRRIRLAHDAKVKLPKSLTQTQVGGLLRSVARGETSTRGIIEQRIVDAVAALQHPESDWTRRGLLDSVNASNMSRKKFGDCEFQQNARHLVVAFEAHAGLLTEPYVLGHLSTLEPILKSRRAEWEENAEADKQWRVKVRFVAHGVDPKLERELEIEKVKFLVEAVTYEEFLSEVDPADPAVMRAFGAYVWKPMSEQRTPDSIRNRLLAIIGP